MNELNRKSHEGIIKWMFSMGSGWVAIQLIGRGNGFAALAVSSISTYIILPSEGLDYLRKVIAGYGGFGSIVFWCSLCSWLAPQLQSDLKSKQLLSKLDLVWRIGCILSLFFVPRGIPVAECPVEVQAATASAIAIAMICDSEYQQTGVGKMFKGNSSLKTWDPRPREKSPPSSLKSCSGDPPSYDPAVPVVKPATTPASGPPESPLVLSCINSSSTVLGDSHSYLPSAPYVTHTGMPVPMETMSPLPSAADLIKGPPEMCTVPVEEYPATPEDNNSDDGEDPLLT